MTDLHLLLVEDCESDAALILRLLQKAAHKVRHDRVETEEALREALRLRTWDLVICDYTLPALDAPQALRLVRACQPETPFIVVSGAVGEDLAVSMMRAGAQDYVMKDDLTRLVPAVERELVESEQRASRKRAESELKDAQKRLASVFENMSDGLVIQASDGSIVECNPAAERLLGLTSEQMRGRTSLDPRWQTIHDDGSPFPGEDHPAMRTLRTGESVRDMLMGIAKPDGTRTWLSVSSAPLANVQAGLPGVVCTFTEVTELKLAGEVLRGRTMELTARNEELMRFNRTTVDREVRMLELKQEINHLLERLGEERKYQSVPQHPSLADKGPRR